MEQNQAVELGEQPSIEDRVLEKLNLSNGEREDSPDPTDPDLPENPDSEAEEKAPDVAYEELEFEGKQYQVPPELKNAFMSKSDYTKRTTELANIRRAVDLQQKAYDAFQQQRAFDQQVAPEVERASLIDAYVKSQYQSINWQQLQPGDAMATKLQLEALEKERDELRKGVEEKRKVFDSQLSERIAAIRKETTDAVAKAIPNWSEQSQKEIHQYIESVGYSAEVIQNMSPLDYQMAWKAKQYDALVQSKGNALKKAQTAPPVVKPGAVRPMPKDVKDMLNFRKAMDRASKTGATSYDKARLIQQRLASKFKE